MASLSALLTIQPLTGWDDYQWNGTPNLDASAQGTADIYLVMTQGAANIEEFWLKNE